MVQAPVGSNLLRAAEAAEAIKLNRSDCCLWAILLLHALAVGGFDKFTLCSEKYVPVLWLASQGLLF